MAKNIQWFPGHMAKAKKEISQRLKLVDLVIEIVDARAPQASRNPLLNSLIKAKPRLIIMTKIDLADPIMTKQWQQSFQKNGDHVLALNLNNFNDYQSVVTLCKQILKDKIKANQAKGLKERAVRAMVLGIPNVGKSTFINRLAKRKAANSGNKPGVTKAQQIIRVDRDFELFDTPGVLWPKFENETVAMNLALIGSIKQDILPLDDIFVYAIKYLGANYPQAIANRYQITIDFNNEDWLEQACLDISLRRGIKKIRNEIDYDRVINLFMTDILQGNMGQITWEQPNE